MNFNRTLGNVHHFNFFFSGPHTGVNPDPCMINKHSIIELFSISNGLWNVNLTLMETRVILTRANSKCATTTLNFDKPWNTESDVKVPGVTFSQDSLNTGHLPVFTYPLSITKTNTGTWNVRKALHYYDGYSWLLPWLHLELTETPMTGHISFELGRPDETSSLMDKLVEQPMLD